MFLVLYSGNSFLNNRRNSISFHVAFNTKFSPDSSRQVTHHKWIIGIKEIVNLPRSITQSAYFPYKLVIIQAMLNLTPVDGAQVIAEKSRWGEVHPHRLVKGLTCRKTELLKDRPHIGEDRD